MQAEPPVAVPLTEEPSAARGSIALLGSFVVIALLNYAFAIAMSWLLPVDRYGMLSVVQTITLLGSTIVMAGFPWALTRALARQPTLEARAGAFRAALLGNAVLGLGLGLAFYGATWYDHLPLGAGYRPLMLIAGATIAVLSVGAVFAAVLQGYLRIGSVGAVRSVEVLVKCAAGTGLVLLGANVLGAIVGFFIGAVIATLLSALLLRGFPFREGRGWGGRAVFAGIGPLFLGMLSLAILVNADIVGLKFFSPAALSDQLTGQYQAAVTLARIPIFLALALLNAIFPFVARYPARSTMANVYAVLTLKYVLLFIIPLDLVFVLLPSPVIHIFYRSAYDASARPLALAALGTILLTVLHALAMLLQAVGKFRTTAAVLSATVAIEVISLSLLVPRYPTVGAPLALIVAGSFGLALLLPIARHSFRLLPAARTLGGYALALAAFGVTLWRFPHGGRMITIATIGGGGIIYLAVLVMLGLLARRDMELVADGLGPRLGGVVRRGGRLIERLTLARSDR